MSFDNLGLLKQTIVDENAAGVFRRGRSSKLLK